MESILIIGCGKLGSSLFRALKVDRSATLQMVSLEPFGQIKSRFISAKEYSNQLTAEGVAAAGIIIIAVQDDAIDDAVKELEFFELQETIVTHTSGALDSACLQPLKAKGAKVCSFHPIQTFPRRFLPLSSWQNIVCSYEGDPKAIPFFEEFCARTGARFLAVTPEQKLVMHLAATIAANYSVALLSWAEQLLETAGIAIDSLKNILYPLVRQTLINYRQKPLEEMLTGALQRGDIATLKKHLHFLADHVEPYQIDLYRNLATQILQDDRFNLSNQKQIMETLKSK